MASPNVSPQKTYAYLQACSWRSRIPLGMLTCVVCARFVYQAATRSLRTRGKYLS